MCFDDVMVGMVHIPPPGDPIVTIAGRFLNAVNVEMRSLQTAVGYIATPAVAVPLIEQTNHPRARYALQWLKEDGFESTLRSGVVIACAALESAVEDIYTEMCSRAKIDPSSVERLEKEVAEHRGRPDLESSRAVT